MKIVAIVLLFTLLLATTSAACPTCKDTVADDPATAATARGFNGAIWVMLGTAGVGVAVVGTALFFPTASNGKAT